MSPTNRTRLENALQTATSTLIYDVDALQSVLSAIESATKKKLVPVDGRGAATATAVKSAIAQQAKGGGPVVVLVGSELSDEVRSALSSATDGPPAAQIIALSNARAPSEEMAALFPLQMAATRALEGSR